MPADPSNEEAAREVVLRGVVAQMNAALRAVGSDAEAVLDSMRSANLDAYRTAIRATLLASLIEKVEAKKIREWSTEVSGEEIVGFNRGLNVALTLLRTEAENG